jgi:hypothetical protein
MVGLFAWIALLVQTVVYGSLVNVVRVEQPEVRGRLPDQREREASETTESRRQ